MSSNIARGLRDFYAKKLPNASAEAVQSCVCRLCKHVDIGAEEYKSCAVHVCNGTSHFSPKKTGPAFYIQKMDVLAQAEEGLFFY